jgi:hypothetical protein
VRNVIVLAPMPLEMKAIVRAFGLDFAAGAPGRAAGTVGESNVTAVHIGMGPPLTRSALRSIFNHSDSAVPRPDHVIVAGICGGLDPHLDVGTLINPEVVIDHSSGARYRHSPPGDEPLAGNLVTTEGVSLDGALSKRFFDAGCIGVDMETSAVAEVCEANGCPWSVYRCIGDRHFDGLLDARVVALTNADGSGKMDEIAQLIAAEPELGAKLEQLSRDSSRAARLAAEAAARGCLALDG